MSNNKFVNDFLNIESGDVGISTRSYVKFSANNNITGNKFKHLEVVIRI